MTGAESWVAPGRRIVLKINITAANLRNAVLRRVLWMVCRACACAVKATTWPLWWLPIVLMIVILIILAIVLYVTCTIRRNRGEDYEGNVTFCSPIHPPSMYFAWHTLHTPTRVVKFAVCVGQSWHWKLRKMTQKYTFIRQWIQILFAARRCPSVSLCPTPTHFHNLSRTISS